MSRRGSLRADLQRTFDQIDQVPDRTVVIDDAGDAWQYSAFLGYWYRAFDADGRSAFGTAQRMRRVVNVIKPEGVAR